MVSIRAFMDTKIEDFNFSGVALTTEQSNKLKKDLAKAKIATLGELFALTETEILKRPGIGRITLRDILAWRQELFRSFTLRADAPPIEPDPK